MMPKIVGGSAMSSSIVTVSNACIFFSPHKAENIPSSNDEATRIQSSDKGTIGKTGSVIHHCSLTRTAPYIHDRARLT
jgi:hypothetical protein